MKRLIAISGVAFAMLSASIPAFALGDRYPVVNTTPGDQTKVSAPEIDVTAGTKGIVVLIAGLLLAGEGLRRRR